MSEDRQVPDKVRRERRKALSAGLAAYDKAVAAGDGERAAGEVETLKALGLVVTLPNGLLVAGPDVADAEDTAGPRPRKTSRRVLAAAVVIAGVLVLLGGPVVFLVYLALTPGHGTAP